MSDSHNAIVDLWESSRLEVTLKFKNVKDKELLMIDIEKLLESISDEGWISDYEEDNVYESERVT